MHYIFNITIQSPKFKNIKKSYYTPHPNLITKFYFTNFDVMFHAQKLMHQTKHLSIIAAQKIKTALIIKQHSYNLQ